MKRTLTTAAMLVVLTAAALYVGTTAVNSWFAVKQWVSHEIRQGCYDALRYREAEMLASLHTPVVDDAVR